MKRIVILLLALLSINLGWAQREVQKTEAIKNADQLYVHFKFADDIKIEQWNKNEIKVDASVLIDDGDGNADFSLQTERSGSTLEISSDFGDYFEKRQKNFWGEDCCNSKTSINYVVYVPKGVKLKVKSISGDVMSDDFSGQLVTDLVSGDVTLKQYKGELRLKTVSGDLDITTNKADVNAKTLTGTIYSNLNIDQEGNKKSSSGYNRVKGTVNNGGELVVLETVSGNIYMRKG